MDFNLLSPQNTLMADSRSSRWTMEASHTNALFSANYATARRRFREAAAALGWELLSYPIDARGPDNEELTIDVAMGAGAKTLGALVISSGIHGVEGFFGSAVQLSLLRGWADGGNPLPPVRLVFVHGLNPFGFAWHRRGNEENVDLNRNLLLPGEPFEGSPPGYAELDRLLNPQRPPSRLEPVMVKFLLTLARHGMPALRRSIASGQYAFPQGLFFGGNRPSRTNELVTANLDRWLGNSQLIMHLDLHTGLGARATWKLLIDYPLTDAQRQRLSNWFGPDSFELAESTHVAFPTRGSFGRWCLSHAGKREYQYAAAEFGTFKPFQVLSALRAENQAHHWCQPEDRRTRRAKQQLVEHFCPQSEDWRAEAMKGAHWLATQAISGLVRETDAMETRPGA